MSDEVLIEEEIIEEPAVEKSDLDLIYEQGGFTENVFRESGVFGNIIYIEISSVALGKKVISIPQYIEELKDGILVGRRVVSYERSTYLIDEEITVTELSILSQEIVERR